MRTRRRARDRLPRARRRGVRPALPECLHGPRPGLLGTDRGAPAGREGRAARGGRARHALRGRGLRGLLLLASPRHEPRPDVPPRCRAAAAQLAPPAGGLPRSRGNGGPQRHARAAPVRPAQAAERGVAALRRERATRHRARGRVRGRGPERARRAGAGRPRARPRVRDGARERLVGPRRAGLGVPAARTVPRQVVRDLGEQVGGAARRARVARGGRRAPGTRSRCPICARSPGPTTSRSRWS